MQAADLQGECGASQTFSDVFEGWGGGGESCSLTKIKVFFENYKNRYE